MSALGQAEAIRLGRVPSITASKKFIKTYNFTLATEYSTDGRVTWHDLTLLAIRGFSVTTDPTTMAGATLAADPWLAWHNITSGSYILKLASPRNRTILLRRSPAVRF